MIVVVELVFLHSRRPPRTNVTGGGIPDWGQWAHDHSHSVTFSRPDTTAVCIQCPSSTWWPPCTHSAYVTAINVAIG